MAPPLPPRLLPALRALLYWSLVYGYCGLCASVHLLKLLWSIGRAPAQTFRWAARANPPACLNDPSLGTHCYVRIKDSGLRFHYVAAGERGKPLMLLLHGFPEFCSTKVNCSKPPSHLAIERYSWRHQLREFKSEYRVVALDLRGYGESDAPTHQESYKLDCLIADIKDILDSLGYSKCVLIGHDWGGMIAWLIAVCYPEMIMKLIVINFPHPSVFTDSIYYGTLPSCSDPAFITSSKYHGSQNLCSQLMISRRSRALKHLFTSQSTGIGRKGRQLTTEDLEAYVYVFSQPGALSGPINHYRNIFRAACLSSITW
ncbi:Epoxide hydrolase 4 [Apodemus speciosus]|uniref:Epoxide hydrolase 4 n=1 Tax=Apodemus speciosus TaxID=105296 RepID=A0ABQ0ESL4_APOSI